MRRKHILFWVGGSGDWHNPANWSSSSGGFGGFGVPNNTSSAVFDQLSFAITGDVITSSTNLNCLDLDFRDVTNMPIFRVGLADTLNIDGSLLLNPDIVWEVQSPVIFRDDMGGRQINTGGHNFLNDVIFEGNSTGGEWRLENDITVEGGCLFIINGSLDADGSNIDAPCIIIPDWI